ncbi:MAG TPA: nitrogenase cofactor biosynthesis protein NifB [Nitrospirota bacterium]
MDRDRLAKHPCFSKQAHHKYGRVHMPVAPACNIQCRYCTRKFDCANESRPGVTSRVLTPSEAMERVRAVAGRDGRVTVVGVAGPGDPLANRGTYELMGMVQREFPELTMCISTNGLLLVDRLDELVGLGLDTLTVTINSVYPDTAERLYSWVRYKGKVARGPEAVRLLLKNQWLGLRAAVNAGLAVKVNSVMVPGINDAEIEQVAELAGGLGATTLNIIPLIPNAEFAGMDAPKADELAGLRLRCGLYIPVMSHCRQCRADAAGLLGDDKDMETETLMALMGEEYACSVAM